MARRPNIEEIFQENSPEWKSFETGLPCLKNKRRGVPPVKVWLALARACWNESANDLGFDISGVTRIIGEWQNETSPEVWKRAIISFQGLCKVADGNEVIKALLWTKPAKTNEARERPVRPAIFHRTANLPPVGTDGWARYCQDFNEEPGQKLFGTDIPLRDIHIPLNAQWNDKKSPVKDQIQEWLNEGDKRDSLRVISGGPGYGKSTFARILTDDLNDACNKGQNNIRAFYIPLHHLPKIPAEPDLGEILRDYLKKYAIDPLQPPSNSRVLLLLDGLDELSMQCESAKQTSINFVICVRKALTDANTNHANAARVLALIGCREALLQEAQSGPNRLLLNTLTHHLLPYSDVQRNQWWIEYGKCVGKVYDGMPEELVKATAKLDELTRLPLLNYLVALSYESGVLDFSGPLEINDIYKNCLKSVHARVWERSPSPDQPQKANPHSGALEFSEFVRLLEEIAIVAWHHGDIRQAPYAAVKHRCANAGLIGSLKKLHLDTDEAYLRLFASFFIKHSPDKRDLDSDLPTPGTVEFTHKTFGEYLAARRIVSLMAKIVQNYTQQPNQLSPEWDIPKALMEWAKLCGPQPLDLSDRNLFELLMDEVRSHFREKTTREQWRSVFADLSEHMLNKGMPMEVCGLTTYSEMDRQARNAEEALLCALYACLTWKTPAPERIPVSQATHFLARWHFRNGVSNWTLAAGCVSALRHLGRTFEYSDLRGADLTDADLRGADLRGADLTDANLTGADLKGAYLTDANLTGADLKGAYLKEADLKDANLTDARNIAYAIGIKGYNNDSFIFGP